MKGGLVQRLGVKRLDRRAKGQVERRGRNGLFHGAAGVINRGWRKRCGLGGLGRRRCYLMALAEVSDAGFGVSRGRRTAEFRGTGASLGHGVHGNQIVRRSPIRLA